MLWGDLYLLLIELECTILCELAVCVSSVLFVMKKFVTVTLNQWCTRWGVGVLKQPPSPAAKFLHFEKAEPNSQFYGKYIHNNIITILVSLICKLRGIPD
jgi:hypothetical protein